ncbi:MAG TPA: hypothetical protein VKB29_11140 [Candidatus Binataceae bacterium]|nr:hypothetical protein [Candidatus Binataceae bacterium]
MTRRAGRRDGGVTGSGLPPSALAIALVLLMLARARPARAIDFYEIQIYQVQTAPYHHLTLELHSNTTTTATGQLAREEIDPYQIHETLEGTYGVLPWLEVGQYLCTAKMSDGNYNYAGSRSKVHFGVPQSENWPIEVGGNIELAYMRFQAEDNPLSLEIRPILEKKFGGLMIVGNFVFEKPFSGADTHKGVQFDPSGEVVYQLTHWVSPAVEYYGDMGPLSDLPGVQRQQHFIVPALNFDFLPQLELNFGVGVGLTRASNGLFIKSIVGWTF